MNIPNLLTLLRIFFVPLLVAAVVMGSLELRLGRLVIPNELLALAIFLAAAATDLLDGFLARRWKQVTTVGMLLDPIADKLLISAALISLVQVRELPAWMAIIVVGREFAVTGLRSIAATAGYIIQASELGKTKMLAQVVAVTLFLLGMHWPAVKPWAMGWMWCVVVVAVLSAVGYFSKFWRKVDGRIKRRRRRELLRLERERARAAVSARVSGERRE
ncbi:MAG: CDP-diacylglycerol--glycerol-3-phosphate 3-phosphatidyltransferase [Acidobacteria bacterium]|nr:CDP-diacylglycerol--glycerol-3-phosphate 3-phosphatidyltransferase [Acidobacteriota bacterium]